MKVILKEDVKALGSIGEIVNVKNGYARNYLIPKGLAVRADAKNLKEFEHHKRMIEFKLNKIKILAEQLRDKIEEIELNIPQKLGKSGKLFGSVTSLVLEKELEKKGLDIDRKKIMLKEPIKTLGNFTIDVKLHPEVIAKLKVNVIAEEEEKAKEEKEKEE
jgi:large subunit ribosomal protein L9